MATSVRRAISNTACIPPQRQPTNIVNTGTQWEEDGNQSITTSSTQILYTARAMQKGDKNKSNEISISYDLKRKSTKVKNHACILSFCDKRLFEIQALT